MSSKILIVGIAPALSIFQCCFGQGSLTPPGAPTPAMRSLAQVEPRIPIASVPFVITQPGSYYLTTNLTTGSGDAIDITTNGVTLDLSGFTITSTLSPANGIAIGLNTGVSDITILNGHIKGGVTNNAGTYNGPGFGYGIYGPSTSNIRVTGVSVSGCMNGIQLGADNSTIVESCAVQTIGGYGIYASSVSHATAKLCGNMAIYADSASDCYGYSTGSGNGIFALDSVINSYGQSAGGAGLVTSTANNCFAVSAGSSDALQATTANGCYGNATGSGRGISATTANNCYGYSANSGYGVYAVVANNCDGFGDFGGTGVYVSRIATGCYGSSYYGTGLSALIANSSYGEAFISGTGESVTYKYNMP